MSRKLFCTNCGKKTDAQYMDGMECCVACGKVIKHDEFSDEPTFFKNAAGQSQRSGTYVKTVQSDFPISHERILNEADYGIRSMANSLGVAGGESITNPALRFYELALQRNFTRGRRKEQVEAACLYIACRANEKPYLLIDFSELLGINVYVLGAVFLQLCKLLSLVEHPLVQKPVDPSLFIHRFADRLLGKRDKDVARTALRIIASMKRDWMQTGRKPSGLCGAALYISALSHGIKCSKSDIVRVVHVCEVTLTKRLIEFENTESGSLTIEEFNMKAEELEIEAKSIKQPNIGSKKPLTSDLLCEHKDSGKPFAHGLCESCYKDFITLSGGLEGGSEPPAFQLAERKRIMEKESDDANVNDSSPVILPCQTEDNSKHLIFEKEMNIPNVSGSENSLMREPDVMGAATKPAAVDYDPCDKLHGGDGTSPKACDEADSFSDIDDVEVDGYLHNEEEKHYKKIIWEEMNKEYLEEQAIKEAAAAAAKEACEANFRNCPEDMQSARELAAAAAAAVAKSRKERQQKRAADARNSIPAQTAAEATLQMLTRKRLSSKINYDVLEKLFEESEAPENHKKSRTEPHTNNDKNLPDSCMKDPESEDTCGDVGVNGGAYENDLYYENVEGGYDYDDNYSYDEY